MFRGNSLLTYRSHECRSIEVKQEFVLVLMVQIGKANKHYVLWHPHLLRSFCFWVGQAFRLGSLGACKKRAFRLWGMLFFWLRRVHTPRAKAHSLVRIENAKPKGLAYPEAKTPNAIALRYVSGYVLSALLALGCLAAPAQQKESPPGVASADKTKAASSTEKSAMTQEQARQAQLRADTERLYKLTQELKDEVAKSNKDTLSVSVVKKAEEVEKLARSVKERMRAAQ